MVEKNQRGITLIALVVTIIVLLILAGITIGLALGENGILGRTQTAAEEHEKAAVLETLKLAVAEGETEYRTNPEVSKKVAYQTALEKIGATITSATDEKIEGTITRNNRTYTFEVDVTTGDVRLIDGDSGATSYAITYNLNGGTLETANPTSYTIEDTITLNNPIKTGYNFAGWTGSNGTTPQISVTITEGSIGEKNYIANYTSKTPTVTLNMQSGSGGTASVTATYESSMPSITVPTREGYTFAGYYTETNGNGTQYYTASGTSTKNCDFENDTTLYANWTINQYNLKINSSVNGNKSTTGHSGFTFDVYVNNNLVADDVITYSSTLDYNTPVKVVLNGKTNYTAIESTIEKNITAGDNELIPAWVTSSNIGIQFKYGNTTLIVITEGKNWENAEAYAQSIGGHLAMIKTADMQNYVYNTILANSTVAALSTFWIGATDKAKEGEWRWVDGTLLSSTYTNWNGGEPNNSGTGENYCQYYVSGSTKGKWNDLNGTQVYPFVVQIGN